MVILLRGDLVAILHIRFNQGDVGYTLALVVFGLYSAAGGGGRRSIRCRSSPSPAAAARCSSSRRSAGRSATANGWRSTPRPADPDLRDDLPLDAGVSVSSTAASN